jgi:drug/metabolite transporter (DMT)-like permease
VTQRLGKRRTAAPNTVTAPLGERSGYPAAGGGHLRRAALWLTIPPLLWSGNAVIGRALVGQVPPFALSALRWGLALLLLAPLAVSVWRSAPRRGEVWARAGHLALLGGLGVGSYNALQYLALTTTTAVNATLILGSSPAWALLIGLVVYGERPRGAQVLGALLSIVGVLCVMTRGDVQALADVRFVSGDLLMLVAVLSWAAYSWMLARPPAAMRPPDRPQWNWAEFLFVQVLFGIGWSAIGASLEAVVAPQAIHWSAGVVAALIYVAIGPSIIAYRCWGAGVAEAGPSVAAFFANLTPLFTALLSTILLGEPPQPYHALAFVLIVVGIVLSSRR